MMEKKDKFEDYLQDKHAEQYIGLDDDMPDDFDSWVQDLDSDDWIRYAEKWNTRSTQGMVRLSDVRVDKREIWDLIIDGIDWKEQALDTRPLWDYLQKNEVHLG